jgi:hypothetical protein
MSDDEAAAVLDHALRSGLVAVQPLKLARAGRRADVRNGLVLTPAGKAVVQQENQVGGSAPTPRPPQHPATLERENAAGAPGGAPATPQGGVGGMRGGIQE